MTNEEVMQLMTDMGLHEGGMDNWVMDNAWFKFANMVSAHEKEKHRAYIHELELELETTQDRLNECLVADYMKTRKQQ